MMPIFENSKPQVFRLPAWRQRGGPRVRLLPAMLCLTVCLTVCLTMATSAQDTGLPALEVRSTDPSVQTDAFKPAPVRITIISFSKITQPIKKASSP
jgi:hypothetical protein